MVGKKYSFKFQSNVIMVLEVPTANFWDAPRPSNIEVKVQGSPNLRLSSPGDDCYWQGFLSTQKYPHLSNVQNSYDMTLYMLVHDGILILAYETIAI